MTARDTRPGKETPNCGILYRWFEGLFDYLRRLSVHDALMLSNLAIGSSRYTISAVNGATYPDRSTYWRQMDDSILKDLEKLVTPQSRPESQQVLTGDILLGMATALAMRQPQGFQKRYTEYVRYAAHAGSVAAQGIVGRLLQAHNIASAENDQVQLGWLENAVNTGSLVAAEDLKRIDVGLFKACRERFRNRGGYNIEASNFPEAWDEQLAELFERTVQSPRALRSALKSPENRLYPKGNTTLHFAAMYGNCSLISYLVEEGGSFIDIQNNAGETPLYKACLSANLAAVRTLVGLGANAGIPAKTTGASCLHWLFNFEAGEMREVAELLIHRGRGDVNAEIVPAYTKGSIVFIPSEHFPFHWPFGTPLHWAIAVRSKSALDTLLYFQCHINASDLSTEKNGQTALTMAMYRVDPDMAELLVAYGAKADNTDSRGRNNIHMLAADHTHMNREFYLPRSVWSWVTHGSSHSHLAQLRKCLAIAQGVGLDLNAVRRKCQTPLIDAVENSDACTILVLLGAGGNANVLNPMGELPLHEWLTKDGRKLTYPELYIPVLEKLVSLTKDLNTRDELYSESIVHRAATTNGDQEQFEASLRLLLDKDPHADINAQDRDGRTPFLKMLASLNTRDIPPRTAAFIRRGADILLKDDEGQGFLYALCDNRDLSDAETFSIMTSILEHVPKPERQVAARTSGLRNGGPNALSPAIHWAKIQCVKMLVELGVDIDAVDAKTRLTPLDLAIHIADYYREAVLSRLMDSFAPADRMDALEDGTAFTDRFLDFGRILRIQLAMIQRKLTWPRFRAWYKPCYRYAGILISTLRT